MTGLTENFSPIPRMAPPPLGSAGIGADTAAPPPLLLLLSEDAESFFSEVSTGFGSRSSAVLAVGLVAASSPERRSSFDIGLSVGTKGYEGR
ncbi:MAG: hypothetical protein QM820_32650 [Minicystis sp.]